MAEVHQLIIRHGIDEARRMAATKHERALVEAAYQVLTEDAEKLGFTHRTEYVRFALGAGLLGDGSRRNADQGQELDRHPALAR